MAGFTLLHSARLQTLHHVCHSRPGITFYIINSIVIIVITWLYDPLAWMLEKSALCKKAAVKVYVLMACARLHVKDIKVVGQVVVCARARKTFSSFAVSCRFIMSTLLRDQPDAHHLLALELHVLKSEPCRHSASCNADISQLLLNTTPTHKYLSDLQAESSFINTVRPHQQHSNSSESCTHQQQGLINAEGARRPQKTCTHQHLCRHFTLLYFGTLTLAGSLSSTTLASSRISKVLRALKPFAALFLLSANEPACAVAYLLSCVPRCCSPTPSAHAPAQLLRVFLSHVLPVSSSCSAHWAVNLAAIQTSTPTPALQAASTPYSAINFNAVVTQHGTSSYKTLKAVLKDVPKSYEGRDVTYS